MLNLIIHWQIQFCLLLPMMTVDTRQPYDGKCRKYGATSFWMFVTIGGKAQQLATSGMTQETLISELFEIY